MKKQIISLLLACTALTSTAQQEYDSIKKVVEEYKGATNIIIPNVRQMMVARLDSNDLPGAKKIYAYAVNVLEKQCITAFYDSEKLLLGYLLSEHHTLIRHINMLNAGRGAVSATPNCPPRTYEYNPYTYYDRLSDLLEKYTLKYFETTRNDILADQTLSPDEAKALAVYYRYLLLDNDKQTCSAITVKKEVQELFGENDHGRYSQLINNVILERITPAKLHFSFEAGGGIMVSSKPKYLPAAATVLMATGVEYKRFIFEASVQPAGGRLHQPLAVKNENWERDSSINTYSYKATLGYFLIDSRRIGLYPYAGVNICSMRPEYNGPTQSKRTRVVSGTGLTAGVALQYKSKRWSNSYSTRPGVDSYAYMGLRLAYISQNYGDPLLKGNTWSCTVSIMGDFGERVFMAPWSWLNNAKRLRQNHQ